MRVIIFCFVVSVSAIHDKSEDKMPTVDFDKRLAYLRANIPKAYYCCKDGEFLNLGNRSIESWGLKNTTCIDKNGIRSNYSLQCERVDPYTGSLEEYPEMEFYFEDNLLVIGDHKYIKFTRMPNEICFGNYTKNKAPTLLALDCPDWGRYETTGANQRITAKLALVSIPFAVLTVIIYSIILELKDLQGLSIVSMSSAYTISLIMIVNANMNTSFITNNSMCYAGGLILYYSIIASFLWMQVISMQLFISIRYPKLPISARKQFGWYSMYAWGVPGFFLILVMTAERVPGSHLQPGMALNYSCWFNDTAAKWAYFLGPMTVVLISNTLLYLASTILLFRQKTNCGYKKLRYKFFFSLRLFVVVGITWLFEPLQLAHGKQHIIWIMADCWNLLQGVFIFIVLVLLRKRALLALISRGYCFCLTPYLQTWSNKLSADEEDTLIVKDGSEPCAYSKNDEIVHEEICI